MRKESAGVLVFAVLLTGLLIGIAQDAAVGQEPITWRRRREVNLVHALAVARLGLQLERGLEEVDVQA